MSFITDVALFIPYLPKELEGVLLEGYCGDDAGSLGRIVSFKQLDERKLPKGTYLFTGSKVFCSHLFAGAFNYLDSERFEVWITETMGRHEAVIIISVEESPIRVLHLNPRTVDFYR